jgi:hypothetical protein
MSVCRCCTGAPLASGRALIEAAHQLLHLGLILQRPHTAPTQRRPAGRAGAGRAPLAASQATGNFSDRIDVRLQALRRRPAGRAGAGRAPLAARPPANSPIALMFVCRRCTGAPLASGRALIEAAHQLLHLASIRYWSHAAPAAPATSWPGWRLPRAVDGPAASESSVRSDGDRHALRRRDADEAAHRLLHLALSWRT